MCVTCTNSCGIKCSNASAGLLPRAVRLSLSNIEIPCMHLI